MAEHNELGKWGEKEAETLLRKKGYIILERDWHIGHRDLDIIALNEEQDTVVFIEVKTRATDFSDPLDAVDEKKIHNLGVAANAYVKMKNVMHELRFDIITVVGTSAQDCHIEHIEDAFNPMFY